ncbi:MAG TPA: MFS transporter [Dehalococcoidia bacterium]
MTTEAHPAAGQDRPISTFAAFSEPGFVALWLNMFCVTLGIVMCITTQFIVIEDLTGSNGAVGAVTFGLGVPMLVLGPLAGVLADRLPKHLILLFGQAAMASAAFVLACLVATDTDSVAAVLTVSVVTGTALAVMGPTQTAYMGNLVRPALIGNATALFNSCLSATRVLGPLAVAALLAWDAIGSAGSLFVVASLLMAGLVPLAALPRGRSGAAAVESILDEMKLGYRHVLERPSLFRLAMSFGAVTLLGFSYFVVLPRFIDNVLNAGDSGYGILVGVSAAGGLAANVLVARLADSKRITLLLNLSALLFGVGLIATGIAPNFWAALATMTLVGAASTAFQVLNNAAAFRETDPAYLGRVAALLNIAWSLTNLAGLPVGIVADAAGERGTLLGVGFGLVALAMLLAAWGAAPVRAVQPALEAEA